MSLEVEERRVEERRVAALRARAHPLRLRMLSLLTGAAMSAAELSRELGVSQALASYHLRQLAAAEVVELAEERSRRGGRERRYRHRVRPDTARPDTARSDTARSDPPGRAAADIDGYDLFVEAVIEELRRRAGQRAPDTPGLAIDAELWVDPGDWEQARQVIARAGTLLHERARRPHEPGTVHVNTSLVMFAMTEPGAPVPDSGG